MELCVEMGFMSRPFGRDKQINYQVSTCANFAPKYGHYFKQACRLYSVKSKLKFDIVIIVDEKFQKI
jgi:hypothetical protein